MPEPSSSPSGLCAVVEPQPTRKRTMSARTLSLETTVRKLVGLPTPHVRSCSDGNTIRPRTSWAVVPDLDIIDTSSKVSYDLRIGSGAAVVVLCDERGLVVGAE